eukprot:6471763-Amphidinium_carterae.2
MDSTTTWTTHQISQIGTTVGMTSATATTRAMDYFKTMLQDNLSTLTTSLEIDEHNLTHLPYRDWCKRCVQGKSKSQHHQRGGLTKQSITQIDYAFIKSDTDTQRRCSDNLRIDNRTWLGYATVVPYKGINAEALKAKTPFIIENGLKSTIQQSDGEPASVELLTELARQLPHVKMQTSPPHSHQSQGLGYSTDIYAIATGNLLREKLEAIITFGEKVYVEKVMSENKKLYHRNESQKHEAIWIGRDTTTGQHITLTEEFGKLQTRTILRLPHEQQTDQDLLLKVTSLTGEYDNSREISDEDTLTIPPPMHELRSPAMPAMKQRTGITQQEWHYKPPDQLSQEQTRRVPKFPAFPK